MGCSVPGAGSRARSKCGSSLTPTAATSPLPAAARSSPNTSRRFGQEHAMSNKSKFLLALVLAAALSSTADAQWTRDSSTATITPTTGTDRVLVGSPGYPMAQLQVAGVYGTNIFRAYGNPG